MDIISCFDGTGNALDKGTLQNGNGTIKKYTTEGELIEEAIVKDGVVVSS
jgi:antitoxin component YwqK of YwqJK toxin-antitoxin module